MGLFDLFRAQGAGDRDLVLLRAVREQMPTADVEEAKIVAAVVGLLGQVAYWDRPYLPEEEEPIRRALARVGGLAPEGAERICSVLRDSITKIAEVEAREYARFLRELADRDLRLYVLDLLLDVAAADQNVSVAEMTLIRRLTDALGLTQEEYNASQARHEERLASRRL
jgi:uncharacterized tellurite resistance protein B-like protein